MLARRRQRWLLRWRKPPCGARWRVFCLGQRLQGNLGFSIFKRRGAEEGVKRTFAVSSSPPPIAFLAERAHGRLHYRTHDALSKMRSTTTLPTTSLQRLTLYTVRV